jgi:hypothetical protein
MKLTLHLALRSRVAKSWPLASPAKARNEDRAKARPTATRFDQDRRELFPVTPDVMLARRRPSWRPPGRVGPARQAPIRQTETGRPMPPGLAGLLVRSQPGLPVSAPPAGLPAGRRARPLASQRPGGRGAGPGGLGTAGRGVNCCSPACRGPRGGRGPELGIGISKPAPAMRAATAAAPASPIGQMW